MAGIGIDGGVHDGWEGFITDPSDPPILIVFTRGDQRLTIYAENVYRNPAFISATRGSKRRQFQVALDLAQRAAKFGPPSVNRQIALPWKP